MAYYRQMTEEDSSLESKTLFDEIFGSSSSISQKIAKINIHWPYCRLFRSTAAWSIIQNYRYLQFLKNNFDLFEENWQFRKNAKLCCRMSNYIESKNYAQCRTHHYKMIMRYVSVEAIILKLTRNFSGQKGNGKLDNYIGLRVDISQTKEEKSKSSQTLTQIFIQGQLQLDTLSQQYWSF